MLMSRFRARARISGVRNLRVSRIEPKPVNVEERKTRLQFEAVRCTELDGGVRSQSLPFFGVSLIHKLLLSPYCSLQGLQEAYHEWFGAASGDV
jgi:hypothetical protein